VDEVEAKAGRPAVLPDPTGASLGEAVAVEVAPLPERERDSFRQGDPAVLAADRARSRRLRPRPFPEALERQVHFGDGLALGPAG